VTGQHRRRGQPAPERETWKTSVLAEPGAASMTVDELHEFLSRVSEAAAAAGIRPGGLRLYAAVRMSGTVKGIWVKLPAPGDGAVGGPDG